MDKQDRTLNAISALDEGIIEKHTKQRIALLEGSRKRRNRRLLISLTSMAASLALIASTVLILVALLGKTVPIYTGMSVSDTFPLAQDSVMERVDSPLYATAPDAQQSLPTGDLSTRPAPSADPFEKPLSDSFSAVGDKRDIWYTTPGQDVYITVHIENPDSFEILSFTLNGQKYTNYMFEQGSDLENLVLKVNVGSAEGVVDYTIDAIKYIDGKKIKDVRMEGDKTVQIGVYTDQQPYTTVTGETIGFNSISFNVAATDALDLIGQSEGKMQAVLYDGTRIVSTKDIAAKGSTAVTFDSLAPNTLYQYALIAVYDALDGDGKITHILEKKSFYTAAHVLFDGITVSKDEVSFALQWASGSSTHSITALALYKDGSKVRDIAANATAIDGLLPNTAYRLVANYTYGSTTGSIEMTFTTAPLQYTVNYMLQDLNGSDYTVEKSETVSLMPGDTFAPEVLAFVGFTAPAAQSKTASLEDETPVIEYRYTRNTYAMAFLNGAMRENQTMLYGAALPTVERAGHSFLGWFDVNGTRHTTVPAAATVLTARWSGELTAEDLLYTGSNRITITGLKNLALADIAIPSYIGSGKVVAIAQDAFRDCDHLTAITLPATLESVGSGAFAGCSALESVRFDGTLAQWCNIAFEESAEIDYDPDTFLYPLARYASNPIVHTGNLYLTSAPEVNAVAGEVTLPAGELGGSFCFVGAPITALTVPEDATVFPYGLLTNCASLTAIHFNATNMPDQDLQPYGMLGAGIDNNGISVRIGANVTRVPGKQIFSGVAIAELVFETGCVCTEIGESAFRSGDLNGNALNYYTDLTLPEGLVSIGRQAFGTIKYVTELILPETLQTIGAMAFGAANRITSLTIPTGVTSIGGEAFGGFTGLTTLNFNAANAELHGCVFREGGTSSAGIALTFGAEVTKVPEHFVSREDSGEPIVTNIISVAFAGNLCTEIGIHAFSASPNLQSITLPNSIRTIGEYAFYGCTALQSITIPDSVTEIGERAFSSCTALSYIIVPEGLELDHNMLPSDETPLTVYYKGATAPDWSTALGGTIVLYCYAETEPVESGNYWHDADGDGIPNIWSE